MTNILSRFLEKRGIKDSHELTPEEKITFETYRTILSKGDVTVDKILEFCESQIGIIESRFGNFDNKKLLNERLLIAHSIYKAIISAIKAPQAEREALEKRLQEELQKD